MTLATKKSYRKKADLNTRPGRFFLAQRKGLTDSEAARAIGEDPRNVTNIERTKTYQACVKKYGEILGGMISLVELAKEHIKNIKQDKDKGAKNVAIKMAKEYIEPETEFRETGQVNVIVNKKDEPEHLEGPNS